MMMEGNGRRGLIEVDEGVAGKEQYESFNEVHSEFKSETVLDTQDNLEKDLILSLQTQVKETAELIVRFLDEKYFALKEIESLKDEIKSLQIEIQDLNSRESELNNLKKVYETKESVLLKDDDQMKSQVSKLVKKLQISYQEMKQQIILFEEDKRMFLAKTEFLEKVFSSVQKEYNDLLASNDVLKQRHETKFMFLKHDHSIEKIGDIVKCFDDEKKVFENKISKLEKDLTQRVKDFDDVKTELSRRTDKFETYFANLEKENALLKTGIDLPQSLPSNLGNLGLGYCVDPIGQILELVDIVKSRIEYSGSGVGRRGASLKALDEGYSSKYYVRKFLRALHQVMAIEESKVLTSLSLDELIGNLKVHEMIIKKDSEIVEAKVERKLIASKAKKESSVEECLTSGSEGEEYAMAVRDFKRCGDPNHLIGECPKPSKDKNQRAFVRGTWSDSGEEDDKKVKDVTCFVAHASNEVCSESSYFSDENSSIDDLALDNEYDKLCKMILKIISQIYDNKCRVTFSEHDSEIIKDGKVIGEECERELLEIVGEEVVLDGGGEGGEGGRP
nr:hypothetical protein [Tanacetum cinerariifolium]